MILPDYLQHYVTGASSIGGKILAIIIIIAVVVGIIAYVVWLQDGVRAHRCSDVSESTGKTSGWWSGSQQFL